MSGLAAADVADVETVKGRIVDADVNGGDVLEDEDDDVSDVEMLCP
jgi:hypothetical protein